MSNETKQVCSWNDLSSFSFQLFSDLLWINKDEFIVCPEKSCYCEGDGIYIFNTRQNAWNKLVSFDSDLELRPFSASYDKENEILFVYEAFGTLTQFDMKTKKLISTSINSVPLSKVIFAEKELHRICGSNSNKHCVWNKELKQFETIHQFDDFDKLYKHNSIYLKSRKSILVFGGKTAFDKYNKFVYEFSFKSRKWNKLNAKIPSSKLLGRGLIKTRNERFCILLGGNGSDTIWIYDVKNKSFRKSNVQCPAKKKVHAAIIDDPESDNLLTFGFVHDLYKEEEFDDVQKMPSDLVQLIGHWISRQTVYLMEYGSGQHWKINLDHILNDI